MAPVGPHRTATPSHTPARPHAPPGGSAALPWPPRARRGPAPAGGVAVPRRRPGERRVVGAVGRGSLRTGALGHGPSVVVGPAVVDLLPRGLADIVDPELRVRVIDLERQTERVAQTHGED